VGACKSLCHAQSSRIECKKFDAQDAAGGIVIHEYVVAESLGSSDVLAPLETPIFNIASAGFKIDS
jgi:hypothetical protein